MTSKQHHEHKHTQSPNINFLIILFLFVDFRGHIVGSSTKRPYTLLKLSGKAQITNLHLLFLLAFLLCFRDEDVLRFDIPVQNFPLVHVLQTVDYLNQDFFAFREREHRIEFFVLDVGKVAHIAVLHHHKNPPIIWLHVELPSKVRINFTMLGWSKTSNSRISCFRYRRRAGFFTKVFLFVHFTEYKCVS